ncbi:hypothetical protein G7081_01450 [Vagococcus coleopterorum]|uniref:DUF5105 domain-containing protein n=1 Tax=Vagococcus coleopterorum TaxID=2714946 RepID=A0A6G8ALB3_9ENTE|nr:hypothetical protein [Vagococcus coleopterorum]QIL45848.1 hypothetical protein G7081_01450 [Vagococcus coleopterorum]
MSKFKLGCVCLVLGIVLAGCSQEEAGKSEVVETKESLVKSTVEAVEETEYDEFNAVNYIDLTFTGSNGKGVANYVINQVNLAKTLFNLDVKSVDELPPQRLIDFENIVAALEIKLNKDVNLKNGDKVKVMVNLPEDANEEFLKYLKVKPSEKIVVVDGLQEINSENDVSEMTDSEVIEGYITFQDWKQKTNGELATYIQERNSEYIKRCEEIGKVSNPDFKRDNPIIINREEEKQIYADAGWLDYTPMPANEVVNGVMVRE